MDDPLFTSSEKGIIGRFISTIVLGVTTLNHIGESQRNCLFQMLVVQDRSEISNSNFSNPI